MLSFVLLRTTYSLCSMRAIVQQVPWYNVVLSLSNLVAIIPYTNAKRPVLQVLIFLSATFSAVFHISEHKVRPRGLPGIGIPYSLELLLLLLDRVFAVTLGLFILYSFQSLGRLLDAVRNRNLLLLILFAAIAGILSEVSMNRSALYTVAHSTWHVLAFLVVGLSVRRLPYGR